MGTESTPTIRRKSTRKLRVGRVTLYLRGKIWYLNYFENGRIRRRWGNSLAEAKQLAAQVSFTYRQNLCRMLSCLRSRAS